MRHRRTTHAKTTRIFSFVNDAQWQFLRSVCIFARKRCDSFLGSHGLRASNWPIYYMFHDIFAPGKRFEEQTLLVYFVYAVQPVPQSFLTQRAYFFCHIHSTSASCFSIKRLWQQSMSECKHKEQIFGSTKFQKLSLDIVIRFFLQRYVFNFERTMRHCCKNDRVEGLAAKLYELNQMKIYFWGLYFVYCLAWVEMEALSMICINMHSFLCVWEWKVQNCN